jgi:aspartyl-tRNA(Asn)/glutamyl-tRNA(Gln) amidotransferase subunit B
VTNELAARIGDTDPADTRLEPAALAALVALVDAGELPRSTAKDVLDELVEKGGDPRAIVAARGLTTAGSDELGQIVDRAIADNADAVEKIRAGNEKAIGAVVGAVMREARGRADGGEVQRMIRERIAAG